MTGTVRSGRIVKSPAKTLPTAAFSPRGLPVSPSTEIIGPFRKICLGLESRPRLPIGRDGMSHQVGAQPVRRSRFFTTVFSRRLYSSLFFLFFGSRFAGSLFWGEKGRSWRNRRADSGGCSGNDGCETGGSGSAGKILRAVRVPGTDCHESSVGGSPLDRWRTLRLAELKDRTGSDLGCGASKEAAKASGTLFAHACFRSGLILEARISAGWSRGR